MMNRKAVPIHLVFLFLAGISCPSSHAGDLTGSEVYELWCNGCHSPGLMSPGTVRLTHAKGAEFALITNRDDLPAEYIRILVRKGYGGMPSFRRTEISELELQSLLDFLKAR